MTFDATIVGGGPAGSIAAFVLAKRGRKVALYERQTALKPKVGESLPGAARPILKHLGLLDLVDSGPHIRSAGNSYVWGENKIQTTDSLRDPNGPGWHLDRARFDADLRAAAVEAGAKLVEEQVCGAERRVGAWVLRTDTGSPRTRWIVDATGRHATVVRRLGARVIADSTLMAAYAWFRCDGTDADTRTLIESTPNGWWYTSRIPGGERVVSFHGEATFVGELAKSELAWEEALAATKEISKQVGPATRSGVIHTTAAWGATLDRPCGKGWLAVGDAATAFDPLSSQGIFNALYTGMKAAEAIDAHLSGDKQAIGRYENELHSIRGAYVANHQHYYLTETRWSESPFWQHMQYATRLAEPEIAQPAWRKHI